MPTTIGTCCCGVPLSCCPSNPFPNILHMTITNLSGCSCLAGTYELHYNSAISPEVQWDIVWMGHDGYPQLCQTGYRLWHLSVDCYSGHLGGWLAEGTCGWRDGSGVDWGCTGWSQQAPDIAQCDPILLQWNSITVVHGSAWGTANCPSGSCCDGSIKVVVTT